MSQSGRRVHVVHAIPGRLRLRFVHRDAATPDDSLAALRLAPGVLAVAVRPAARSAVVQYDPARTTDAAILAALREAGVEITEHVGSPSPPSPADDTIDGVAAGVDSANAAKTTTDVSHESTAEKTGGRSELLEALIGPPPKFDRRFAESLALSAVSFVGARQVALAFGGGMTLPAYFAIWFALRRLTGAGRRR